MQNSKIFSVILFSLIIFFGNVIDGHQIDFPSEVCASGLITGNHWPCITQLANTIFKLHSWSEDTSIDICGIECTGNLKGRISKWKWKWDGRFRCHSIAPNIIGQDSRKSRNGAMEWAIKDFINKAIASGHLKVQDFQC